MDEELARKAKARKKGKAAKQKGARGELEFARELERYLPGTKARRGRQFSGGDDSPDVITNIPGVHFEVKRTEKLRLWEAMLQAISEAGGKIPVVGHRANDRPWVIILRLEDLRELAEIIVTCYAPMELDTEATASIVPNRHGEFPNLQQGEDSA